jgi:hypothetical protein
MIKETARIAQLHRSRVIVQHCYISKTYVRLANVSPFVCRLTALPLISLTTPQRPVHVFLGFGLAVCTCIYCVTDTDRDNVE